MNVPGVQPSAPVLDGRPLDFAILRRLWGFTRPHARTRNLLFALVALRAIQLPLLAWGLARVISGPIAQGDVRGTVVGVVAFALFAAFTELCFVGRMALALRLGEFVAHDLRDGVYAHLLSLPLPFFERTPAGLLTTRMTSDVDVVRVGVQDVAFVSAVQAGTLVVSAALMMYYDAALFAVVLLMAPVLWFIVRALRGRLSAAFRAQQESFSRVTATLAESIHGMREIQSFARQNVSSEAFGRLVDDHSKNNMDAARRGARLSPLLEFNGQVFLSILLVLGGHQVLSRQASVEVLIQFLFLSTGFFAAIPHLGNQYSQALTAMAGAERIFALLDTTPDWREAPDAVPLAAPAAGDAPGGTRGARVEFRAVTFEYEPTRPVLTDVSLLVEPNQTVALVGHTGGGKSTFAKLISKLYLPSAGEIFIDGREIRQITSESLHGQIACVTQDNFLYSGTVRDNIRLGRPTAGDDEVRAVVATLGVLDVIEGLPQGFSSVVGERGRGLSAGQRQIVCFARALLARPRILILDEATSAVDAITESRIQSALSRLLEGRTNFIIAHRLSTIRHADLVAVLDHGRIVELGNHPALMASGGKYAQMYRRFVKGGPARQPAPAIEGGS